MTLTNSVNIKKTWNKPTVSETFMIIQRIAEKYNLSDWREVHKIIGVTERTIRRWKKNADTEPDAISVIPFQPFALLFSIANEKSYIKPLFNVSWQSIPSQYFYNHYNYKCLSANVIKEFIGLNSLTKKTLADVGAAIGIAPSQLSQQINTESVSWLTWTLFLLYVGVPPNAIFLKNDINKYLIYSIQEIEDKEKMLRKGELVVTLQNDMPPELVGKILCKKLSRSKGAAITVRMIEGDPTQ